VRADLPKIKRYLMEITKNANDLNQLINEFTTIDIESSTIS